MSVWAYRSVRLNDVHEGVYNVCCRCLCEHSVCLVTDSQHVDVRPSAKIESCVSRCKRVCEQGHCYPCMSSVAVGCDDLTVSNLQE